MNNDISIENLNINTGTPEDRVLTIKLNDYIVKNGALVAENEFVSEEIFYDGGESQLEEYICHIIDVSTTKSLIVLDVPYLIVKTEFKKKLEGIISSIYPDIIFKTAGQNNYILIIKAKEVNKIIFSFSDYEIEQTLSLIFLKKLRDEELEFEQEDECDRLVFPIIQSIKHDDSTADSITFTIPCNPWTLKQQIIDRNQLKYNETYRTGSVQFIVLIHDPQTDCFRVDQESGDNKVTIRGLQANKGYFIKIAIKFGELFSETSKAFVLFTIMNENEKTSYYATGNNANKCLMINELNYDRDEFKSRVGLPDEQFRMITSVNFLDNFVERSVRLKMNNVHSVQLRSDNSMILLKNGKVLSMSDEVSNLNNDPTFDMNNETLISPRDELYYINLPKYVRKISCGETFSLFLTLDNECYSYGFNKFGELGLNLPEFTYVMHPQKVKIEYDNRIVPILDIATGSSHALAKIYHNEKSFIYTWGQDQKLQYSLKNPLTKKTSCHDTYLRENSNIPNLLNFLQAEYVVSMRAAHRSSALICYNPKKGINMVYTNGKLNKPSNLGYSVSKLEDLNIVPILVDAFTEKHSVIDVSFGPYHALFLVKNLETGLNEVYVCGKNDNSVFGPSDDEGFDIPRRMKYDFDSEPLGIYAGITHSTILTRDKDVLILGKNDDGNVFKIYEELDLKDKKIKDFGSHYNNIYILTDN
jgi:alpha-tubulin suppressor-like RCC1 family protein